MIRSQAMKFANLIILDLLVAHCSCTVEETHDIENFKAVMHRIFLDTLGEDLRRKMESISNEGVMLKKTNEEIQAMAMARLNADEKKRMKEAFKAIAGPAKKLAKERLKAGKAARRSDYKTKTNKKRSTITERTNEKTSVMSENWNVKKEL